MTEQSPFSGMDLSKAPPPQDVGMPGLPPQPSQQAQPLPYQQQAPIPGPFANLQGAAPVRGQVQPAPKINTQNVMDQIRQQRSQQVQNPVVSNGIPDTWNAPDENTAAPFSPQQLASINQAFHSFRQEHVPYQSSQDYYAQLIYPQRPYAGPDFLYAR